MSCASLPDNLRAKVLWAKDGVHEQLEVVARGRVAVHVDAAGGLQHAMELEEADGHNREVGHHVVVAQELVHGCQEVT